MSDQPFLDNYDIVYSSNHCQHNWIILFGRTVTIFVLIEFMIIVKSKFRCKSCHMLKSGQPRIFVIITGMLLITLGQILQPKYF